jgi:hypothetical protein
VLADWDPRLISPEQALRIAGDWPVYASHEMASLSQFGDQPDRWQINLRCLECGQSCGLLDAPRQVYKTSIGDLLSGVLRHMVTAHDWSLSGATHGE